MSPADPPCGEAGCGRAARYRFPRAGGAADRCGRHALLYRPILRRSAVIAGVVGSVLFLINQADVVLAGAATGFVVFKSALTYFVPFSVSTYSALAAGRLSRG